MTMNRTKVNDVALLNFFQELVPFVFVTLTVAIPIMEITLLAHLQQLQHQPKQQQHQLQQMVELNKCHILLPILFSFLQY